MDILEAIEIELPLPEWDEDGNLIVTVNDKSNHHLAARDFKRWFKVQLILGNIKPENITSGPFNSLPPKRKKRIYDKIKTGKLNEITDGDLKAITGLDFSQTSKMTCVMHQIINYIFGGNASPLTVLKILDSFLSENYYSSYHCFGKKKKRPVKKRERFLWLFHCVASYKGREGEIEREKINNLAERNEVVIKDFLPLFKISREDIKDFLDEYFLYYDYERRMDFWEMVERKGFRPTPGKSIASRLEENDDCAIDNKRFKKIKKKIKEGHGKRFTDY